ncbi:protein phosphatase 1 regulatory subunit 36 [Acanthochromis polyacanthus]|uniref:protein phosphatase 1 regulatory subunit 36 n=1 Tax=Acanthochromis polyacanthus TaxID=80966 RepID=UPI0022348220|nr:protein phosphatase 1 regulatory subunit 36 [Acanthochromis polyacanthus]
MLMWTHCTDIFSEHQQTVESLAKKQVSQRKLAVRYFSLMVDLQKEQRPQNKRQMSSSRTEWLLHASLYSFFCLLCWVTLGRRPLREIQEELGRLFYSDAFNRAMRNRTDEASDDNGSAADPEEATRTRAFRQRTSPRPSSLSSVLNQRSPLMVSLLPSPKERSPHLFSGRCSPSQVQHDEALMEQLDLQLDQQLDAGSFGILGKPLDELNRSSLLDQNNLRGDDDEDDEGDTDDKNDAADPPGVQVQGNDGSFRGSSGRVSTDSEASVEQTHRTLQLL